jgi:hypothetical protein
MFLSPIDRKLPFAYPLIYPLVFFEFVQDGFTTTIVKELSNTNHDSLSPTVGSEDR